MKNQLTVTGKHSCNMMRNGFSHGLASAITPACLHALYGMDYTPVATDRNSYGIVEYTPQAYIKSDLDLVRQLHGLP